MRAAYYEKNGAAREVLKLGEVETPEPGPGEVRVKVAFSGVNPSDVKARAGSRKITVPRLIPHSDAGGVIDKVGPGVSPSRVGQRVWTWNGQWKRPFGTCAEYIALPEALAVPLPDDVSFEAGACLGIPAMTASHAIDVAKAESGKTLLISGGAGSVSHYAIQFAKARGATVLTTVSSEAKARLAREAGADHVIDYKRENVGERVKAITAGQGVDAMVELDISANAALIADVLRPRGHVVVYGNSRPTAEIPSAFCLLNQITLQYIFVYELTEKERARTIEEIMRLMREKRLIHNVAQRFPLSEIVAAHEAVEQGRFAGNVVVAMP
ncbi:MAG TPA: NADPH:quinone reductase [Xanthobacteraceae bacterium]|nr:NADPH:quinone reductase [Xanthobacteraceae bacterium]